MRRAQAEGETSEGAVPAAAAAASDVNDADVDDEANDYDYDEEGPNMDPLQEGPNMLHAEYYGADDEADNAAHNTPLHVEMGDALQEHNQALAEEWYERVLAAMEVAAMESGCDAASTLRDTEIFPGATYTCATYAYSQLKLAQDGHMTDTATERQFHFGASVHGAATGASGSPMPPSRSAALKMMNCRLAEDCVTHLCSHGCNYKFPSLSRRQWAKHMDDKCEKCGGPRFAGGKPVNWFINMGVTQLIQEYLFTSEVYCKNRGYRLKGPDDDSLAPEPLWSAPEGARLNTFTGGRLLSENAQRRSTIITFDLGYDGAQAFDKGSHTVGVFVLRCARAPLVTRAPIQPASSWPPTNPPHHPFSPSLHPPATSNRPSNLHSGMGRKGEFSFIPALMLGPKEPDTRQLRCDGALAPALVSEARAQGQHRWCVLA